MLNSSLTTRKTSSRNRRCHPPVQANSLWEERPVSRKPAADPELRRQRRSERARSQEDIEEEIPATLPGFPDEEEELDHQIMLAREPRRVQMEREVANRNLFFVLLPITIFLVVWTVQLLAS